MGAGLDRRLNLNKNLNCMTTYFGKIGRLCEVRRELLELRREDHRHEPVGIQREQWTGEQKQGEVAEEEKRKPKRREQLMDWITTMADDPEDEDESRKFRDTLDRIRRGLPLGDYSKVPGKGRQNAKIAPNRT
jgi:hypothetical protein